jgi:hypothetical protein
MGVLMTSQAIVVFFAMRWSVALGTFGHQFSEIAPNGVIGMENLMALPTIKPVLATILSDLPEMRDMTPTAVGHSQRFRFHIVRV